MSVNSEYDVLVLGGGTAGTAAAKAAAESGARVAMFNDGELGGLCILRGCMPTKTLLHAAHLRYEARHHHTPGIGHATLELDFAKVMANKSAKVERFRRAKLAGIERAGYDVIDARAAFAGPGAVVAGGQEYVARKGFVIASGSVQSVPPVEGIESVDYWTSDDLMNLTELPKSMIVVGVGAIGLEFAQFFARMGTAVTLVSRRGIFCTVDPAVGDAASAMLDAEPNLTRLSHWRPLRVQQSESGRFSMDLEGPSESRTIEADTFLLATGRRAAIDDLNLEAAGIEVERGRVVASPAMQTTNPKVFVAGDATGERLLLHVANWEGRAAGLGAAGVPGDHVVERRLHVEVVFLDPPMACVGMNEAHARNAGFDVVTAQVAAADTGRAITMDVQHGVMKLVADRRSGKILGAQMLCPRADDIVHTIASIMYYQGTAADMLKMPWYHPTLTEVLLQLAREVDAQVVRH
ncbi:MAG: FAD-dependent oxidoreductase [Planctomycetes bacterium]|nr:FAD-dependent oxidoreductase [Planctomycetota bacterium]